MLTSMSPSLSRPSFFPGQLIDYKDFNRLASQSDRTQALLCRYLFDGGGILVDAAEEFDVVPGDKLSLTVKPGVAILPTGEMLVLSEDLLINLESYVSHKNAKTVIVSLRNTTKGTDRYEDAEDATISGFRTEKLEPEVVVTSRKVPEDAVELFRVHLSAGTVALRCATEVEEWEEKLIDPEGAESIIDVRARKRIVPQTYLPASSDELIAIRKAMYKMEEKHRKLQRIYLIEDKYFTQQYLAQLHAELLCRPYQPLKVSFLRAQFAQALSLYLELLSRRLGSEQGNLDRATLMETIHGLEKMRAKAVVPQKVSLDGLLTTAQQLEALVAYAERKYNVLNSIEEGLLDVQNQLVNFEPKLSLGGQVLERVDLISQEDSDRYQLEAKSFSTRQVATVFKNGDKLALRGKFAKEGSFLIDLEVGQPDKPVVLLAHQYIRRAGSTIHYEINGKHLVTVKGTDNTLSNRWNTRGIVISADQLISQNNQLRVRIEKSDLDFGFFDLAVYQPMAQEE